MLKLLWEQFKAKGYSGSVSTRQSSETVIRADSEADYRNIHDAIYNLDSEYTYVFVIQEGFVATDEISSISLGLDPIKNRNALEDALMEGLGHKRIFREATTGAIVQFGYKLD